MGHYYRFKRGDRVIIATGSYQGCTGTVDSAVFQRTVDQLVEYAPGYHVVLDNGEVVTVRWDHVDLDEGVIDIRWALQKVQGKVHLVGPKTSSSVRSVALTELAVGALRRRRMQQIKDKVYVGQGWANEMNLVFTTPLGTPLDKDNVRKRELPPLLKAGGMPTELRFHDL